MMYYSKEELEKIRKQGEEKLEKLGLDKVKDINGYKYKANDIQVTCVHCKHDKFEYSNALLNSRGMSFLGLDWLNDSASTLMCKRCGFIHWFGMGLTKMED